MVGASKSPSNNVEAIEVNAEEEVTDLREINIMLATYAAKAIIGCTTAPKEQAKLQLMENALSVGVQVIK
jgi:hypothetical protein